MVGQGHQPQTLRARSVRVVSSPDGARRSTSSQWQDHITSAYASSVGLTSGHLSASIAWRTQVSVHKTIFLCKDKDPFLQKVEQPLQGSSPQKAKNHVVEIHVFLVRSS